MPGRSQRKHYINRVYFAFQLYKIEALIRTEESSFISACRKSTISSHKTQAFTQIILALLRLAVLTRFAMLIICLQKSENPEVKIPIAHSYPKGNTSILTSVE